MFSATSLPGPTPLGELRSARLSLNSPVVAIEDLPVGPARAGIALHEGPAGRSLVLAVRSVRTGQVLLFAPDPGWLEIRGPGLELDAALSFAEGMGFLFDEDLVDSGDLGEAARCWAEFLAEDGPEAVAPEIGTAPASETPAESAATDARALPSMLSKFRWRAMSAPVVPDPAVARGAIWTSLLSRF